jgi:hypothetical protein
MKTIRSFKVVLSRFAATSERHLIKNMTLAGIMHIRSNRFRVLWYHCVGSIKFDLMLMYRVSTSNLIPLVFKSDSTSFSDIRC